MNDEYNSNAPASGFNIFAVFLGLMVLFVMAAILFPVFSGCPHYARPSGCQANLKQIGNSLKMYLADWNETYPTNRPFLGNNKLGPISSYVKLSAVGTDKITQKAYRFQNGVNWVEGLYNYMEPIVERKDTSSVWKCPQSNSSARSASAEVSYAFNRNLIEQPEKVIQSGSVMMMVSEVDGLFDAELRPTNKSNKNPSAPPQNTFCSAEIHGKGSHILFADGHLKLYSAEKYFSKGSEWDAKSKGWFNAGDGTPGTIQAIQITH